MRVVEIKVPPMSQPVIIHLARWLVPDGAPARQDLDVCELEIDAPFDPLGAVVRIPAPASGVVRHLRHEGDRVEIGEVLGEITGAD